MPPGARSCNKRVGWATQDRHDLAVSRGRLFKAVTDYAESSFRSCNMTRSIILSLRQTYGRGQGRQMTKRWRKLRTNTSIPMTYWQTMVAADDKPLWWR